MTNLPFNETLNMIMMIRIMIMLAGFEIQIKGKWHCCIWVGFFFLGGGCCLFNPSLLLGRKHPESAPSSVPGTPARAGRTPWQARRAPLPACRSPSTSHFLLPGPPRRTPGLGGIAFQQEQPGLPNSPACEVSSAKRAGCQVSDTSFPFPSP